MADDLPDSDWDPEDLVRLWADTPDELKLLITRVSRLKRLEKFGAPETIVNNERSLVAQASMDATLACAGIFSDHRRHLQSPDDDA